MKKLFMAVIALMMTLSASAQFYIYCSDGNVIKVDSISMIAPADAEDPTNPNNPSTPSQGIGTFSVSATKQVTFSPGNLQYHPANNVWQFAANQTDYIGDANANISSTYNGWLDMFGWGTGDNPTNYSEYDGDYQTFVDWGTNKIGCDTPNTWRTLAYNEWYYILFVRENADGLCGIACVDGVNGLILLPDDWTGVDGLSFISGFHSDDSIEAYAMYQTLTADQWSKLETSGAVFLPATGRRDGVYLSYMHHYGDYWSASEYDFSYAYFLSFSSFYMDMHIDIPRSSGRSVRLVKDLEGNSTPTPGNENGHEYVDLGLSVKWATCNVGASKPEEYGDYFAWGETQPKDYYDWSTYKWCNGSYNTLTKYNNSSSYGTVDNKTQLELSDDAARANWGGSWRMPTRAEQDELRENCTWTWTTQNGVNGYKVTSKKNGNSIFLPAAGGRDGSSLGSAGSYGYYWSSSLNTDYSSSAYDLGFYSDYVGWYYGTRRYGFSVRPVCQ